MHESKYIFLKHFLAYAGPSYLPPPSPPFITVLSLILTFRNWEVHILSLHSSCVICYCKQQFHQMVTKSFFGNLIHFFKVLCPGNLTTKKSLTQKSLDMFLYCIFVSKLIGLNHPMAISTLFCIMNIYSKGWFT